MKKVIFMIHVLILFFCCQVTAQKISAIDSLKIRLKELNGQLYSPDRDSGIVRTAYFLSFKLRGSNHDTASVLIDQCIGLSEKMNWQKSVANSKYVKGLILEDVGKYKESNELLFEANKYYESLKSSKDSTVRKFGIKSSNSVLVSIANNYAYLGEYDKSLKIHFELLKAAEESGQFKETGVCYTNIGIVYGMKGDYKQSLVYTRKSNAVDRKLNDSLGLAITYENIGNALFQLKENEEAIINYDLSLAISRKLDNKYAMVRALNGLGDAYSYKGNYKQALTCLLEANEIEAKAGNESSSVQTLSQIGNCYLELDSNKEAGKYLLKALEKTDDNTEQNILATLFESLSKWYSNNNDFANALRYHKQYADIKEKLHDEEVTRKLAATEAKHEFDLKETKLNAAHEKEISEKQLQINLSKTAAEKKQAEVELLSQQKKLSEVEAQKLDAEVHSQKISNEKISTDNKLLAKENELKSIETSNEKRQKNFAFAGLAVLLLFAVLIFNLYSKRKKLSNQLSESLVELKQTQQQLIQTEREKEAEKTRVQISRDLHDDLGATLSSISVYSAAAKNRLNTNNISEVGDMLERISTDAQEMVANVSEKVWMMKTENNTVEKLIEHLQLFASSVLTAKNISFRFNCDEKLKQSALNAEARKNIYLIFKEAINNVAKYSQGTAASMEATLLNNNLQVVLSDNGKGFDPQSNGNHHDKVGGNGLKNMLQRAAELNGELKINSSPGKGTSINFFCALPIIGEKMINS
ncbi:MAG: tetratricopeptide repeat protein [Bacteroidia bacterium]